MRADAKTKNKDWGHVANEPIYDCVEGGKRKGKFKNFIVYYLLIRSLDRKETVCKGLRISCQSVPLVCENTVFLLIVPHGVLFFD
jgi:hypothetical protein